MKCRSWLDVLLSTETSNTKLVGSGRCLDPEIAAISVTLPMVRASDASRYRRATVCLVTVAPANGSHSDKGCEGYFPSESAYQRSLYRGVIKLRFIDNLPGVR